MCRLWLAGLEEFEMFEGGAKTGILGGTILQATFHGGAQGFRHHLGADVENDLAGLEAYPHAS
jgi:hypothetical protein